MDYRPVVTRRSLTEQEKAEVGRGRTTMSDPSPYAHIFGVLYHRLVLAVAVTITSRILWSFFVIYGAGETVGIAATIRVSEAVASSAVDYVHVLGEASRNITVATRDSVNQIMVRTNLFFQLFLR